MSIHTKVILGGRVMDPESGLDAIRNIAIDGDRITLITMTRIAGHDTIDARGLVVAPGFIDLHQHAQDSAAYRVEALDGTTTALELEEGPADVAAWYATRANGALINYGASVGHVAVRKEVMHDTVHLRNLEEPQYFLELEEAIAAGAATGASVHVVHIQSSALEDTPRMLDMIRGARAHGLDVTTECYPYDAAMSDIASAASEAALAAKSDAWFARLEWPATGERLTRESFRRYRAIGGNVVIHNNTDAVVQGAVADSLTMIASDGILHDGIGHPRVAGTYARVLGPYVRDLHLLSLMSALRKMTLMPARRLEQRVPAMRRKGRVRIGADADLAIFDPRTIADRATYRQPTLSPVGMEYVLVNGNVVVRHGRIVDGLLPGRPVRAPVR
jgi:dihydroorotase